MHSRGTQRHRERLRVAVLMGGPSSEHEVSLQGGRNVVAALPPALFHVRPVVITREGLWRMPRGTWQAPPDKGPEPTPRSSGFDPHESEDWREHPGASEALAALREWEADVAFPVLHGAFGEDGTIQGCLQAARIPFVGSGLRASALAFDKVHTKEVLAFHGIDTPAFEVVDAADLGSGRVERIEGWIERLGLPLILKNPCGGSSLEVRKANDAGEVMAALDALVPPAPRLLLETRVVGRELTAGVIEDRERGEPMALPVAEIRPRHGDMFDYREKYAEDGAEEICPAPLDDETTERVRALGLRVYRLLGLRGLARTDMILDAEGRLQVLEVNTLPGMTERGLVPLAAAAMGISFPTLVANLVRTARLDT